MTPEEINSIAGMAVMVGWAILILGPRRFAVLNAIPLWIIPGMISAVYSIIVLSRMWEAQGGFDSLASVASLFQNEWALLAGWVHFSGI
ncbi:MAG: abscisic acid-deficient protein Aba4 family protein [Pseudomonadota bacterium]